MSQPRTGELQHAAEDAEGARVDPARFEEAIAAFSDRVRELEQVAGELRTELRALRARRDAPAPPLVADAERWPAEVEAADGPDWIAAVPAPLVRPNRVPRLALEGAFLLLVALFAGLADLAVEWIVLVMVCAWALVVLGEWAAAARRAHWRLDDVAPPLGEVTEATNPWDVPVAAATVVDLGPDPESRTVVTRLPAPEAPAEDEPAEPEAAAAEDETERAEAEPPKRRRFLRRKAPVEAAPADPWET